MASNPSRQDVVSSFELFSQLVGFSRRPLPTQTGDYTYLPEEKAKANVFQVLKSLLNIDNLTTLKEVFTNTIETKPIDDKTYLMERVIELAAELPLESKSGKGLTSQFLTTLWKDLEHPPKSFLGDEYIYRMPDGSNNNIMWPHIGKAGMSYARTILAEIIQPVARPEPEVIFDAVMKRKEGKFRPHPNQISSVLYYLASIIIHDIFRTNHGDFNISDTSSYLDLAPLYGSNKAEQELVRTFYNGKLKPDVFAEKRILGFPPGVGCLLIFFNRFHNNVAWRLNLIDENKRFSSIGAKMRRRKPETTQEEIDAAVDHHLFNTARLVTCGMYVQIILKDYVRTILNLNRTNSPWDLDPRAETGKSLFGDGASEATGNQVSAEFNCVYRWHSCLSQRDEKWSEAAMDAIFKDVPADKRNSFAGFVETLETWAKNIPDEPLKRRFENLERTGENKDGPFADEALAEIWTASVKDCAGAYGANHVPEVMKMVEVLGIKQTRAWNLASLNEFRKYFKLKPHDTFESINPDPEVVEQLKRLYDHPDFVELYPGIVVEEPKKAMAPGSGLCTTYTTSRAVLSDAVSLVRGDRFYTVDYSAKNLTNWGFNEVNYDLSINQGCVFYKLILQALPNTYKSNSIYAHYPMTIPSENEKIMKDLGRYDDYDYSEPRTISEPQDILGYTAVKQVLSDRASFKPSWTRPLSYLSGQLQKDYSSTQKPVSDAALNAKSRKDVRAFYSSITKTLLDQKSYQIADVPQVDIIRDVINTAQVHFAASLFSLPLKTKANPSAIFTEHELYTALSVIATTLYYDNDATKSFPLRAASRRFATMLADIMETNIRAVKGGDGLINQIKEYFYQHEALTDYGETLIKRLIKTNPDLDAKGLIWRHLLPSAASCVVEQAAALAAVVDWLLAEEQAEVLKALQALAKEDTRAADEQITRYFLEGVRVSHGLNVTRYVSRPATITIEDGTTFNYKSGDRLKVHILSAGAWESKTFPDPNAIKLDRKLDSYLPYLQGPSTCFTQEMSVIGLSAMLKEIVKLERLQRVTGPQGLCSKGYNQDTTSHVYMSEDERIFSPFPCSMKVRWEGEISGSAVSAQRRSDVPANGTEEGPNRAW